VIGVVVSESLPGPFVLVVVPNTELAITWGITDPSPHDETVKVNDVPEEALIENTQPVAVPAFEKSLFATEFTF
jgi:hypothetical protein